MFPDGCTLPGSTQQRILVVLLKTSQTGVQHFWKRHVRLGGIGLPSILGFHREGSANCIHVGCMVRSPPTYWRVRKRKFRVLRYVWAPLQ